MHARAAKIGGRPLLHSAINPRQAVFDQRQTLDAVCGLSPTVDSIRGFASYERGEEIYSGTDSSEYWYCVISGAARKYALLCDGRRRVIDFLLPGNFFGFQTRACIQLRRIVTAANCTPARKFLASLS
jgi:Cyclic nucleotide-binding domain